MKDFIYRIGPITTPEQIIFAYFVYPGREGAEVFFEQDDQTALSKISNSYSVDTIECEPDLASVAAQQGISTGEITPERAHMIGMSTFDFSLPLDFEIVDREALIYQFGMSCGVFFDAAPWKIADIKQPIEVRIEGTINALWEACIIGEEGGELGLAIYFEPGSIEKVHELASAGQVEEATGISTLGVTLATKPDYAIDAMSRAYGLPRLPIPVKVSQGERSRVTDEDLLVLAATLQAISAIPEISKWGRGILKVEDLEVTVTVLAR